MTERPHSLDTPAYHLAQATDLLDQATRAGVPADEASAFALRAQGHAILAGELNAAAPQAVEVLHECILPDTLPDEPTGPADTHGPTFVARCVDCDQEWTLARVTPNHLTWYATRLVRRPA